jgi:F-type H+-transporting ATPase subunit alpha
MDLTQYREVAAFAQFGTSELDKATRAQLERGQRVTEILKQPQYVPMPMHKQVLILYAAINGYLDDIAVADLAAFEENYQRFMETSHADIGQAIVKDKDISSQTEEAIKKAIAEFKNTFYAGKTVAKES